MKLTILIFFLFPCFYFQQNKAILSLSWLAGFCQSVRDCKMQILNSWDHQSFTIHGFWVDKPSPYNYGQFDLTIFNATLLADMKTYWPPQSKTTHSPTFLWEHEFQKHGSDFSNLYRLQHRKDFVGLTQDEEDHKLQLIYFDAVIKLYKALKVQKIAASSYSKAEFASYLGLKENQFSLVCNQGSATLQQIRICYDVRPSGSVIVQCTNVTARNCENNEVVLGSWKKSNPKSPVMKL